MFNSAIMLFFGLIVEGVVSQSMAVGAQKDPHAQFNVGVVVPVVDVIHKVGATPIIFFEGVSICRVLHITGMGIHDQGTDSTIASSRTPEHLGALSTSDTVMSSNSRIDGLHRNKSTIRLSFHSGDADTVMYVLADGISDSTKASDLAGTRHQPDSLRIANGYEPERTNVDAEITPDTCACQVVQSRQTLGVPSPAGCESISGKAPPSTISYGYEPVSITLLVLLVTVIGLWVVQVRILTKSHKVEIQASEGTIIHMRAREQEKTEHLQNRDHALREEVRRTKADMTKCERKKRTGSHGIVEIIGGNPRLSADLEAEVQAGLAKAQQMEEQHGAKERHLRLVIEHEVTVGRVEAERLQMSNGKLQDQLKHCNDNLRHQIHSLKESESARKKTEEEIAELKVRLASSLSEVEHLERYKTELISCRGRTLYLERDVERLNAEADVQRGVSQTLESKLKQVDAQLAQSKKNLDLSESRYRMLKMEADRRCDVDARLRESEMKRGEAERALAALQKEYQAQAKKGQREQDVGQVKDLLRQQEWQRSTTKEEARCRVRDAKLVSRVWNEGLAIDRFKAVLDEFEKAKCSESQPLTSAAIPWPVLTDPFSLAPQEIEWADVEKFLAALQRRTGNAQAFRQLLGRAQRVFHPDRWRSRGLLKTVIHEELRTSLEVTGNKVSQAINSEYTKGN
ncbi:hypothetical protein VNI00_000161 [Paramarasmius palmivorus]|uniref:Uncharacterized protein n=1 Tax=Paramarasmius palmivorus TaxID=297713 RepID=A0AAW0EDT0_9AGAR